MAISDTGRRKLLFGAKFLVLLAIFYVVIAIHPVNDHVVVPFTAALTRISAALLRVLDRDIIASGTTIASKAFAMDVKNGCNAVEAMMLFAAAVLSFPAAVRLKAVGLLAGLAVIQLVNLIRLTSLFWLGARHPSWFNVFHIAVWQTIIILVGVAMFALWSSRSAAAPARHR